MEKTNEKENYPKAVLTKHEALALLADAAELVKYTDADFAFYPQVCYHEWTGLYSLTVYVRGKGEDTKGVTFQIAYIDDLKELNEYLEGLVVKDKPQLDSDESEDTASTERTYQTKEAATALIRRAYNIYELSKADVGFGSNCCRVSGGYWPSVTIFHDSLGRCGSKVIDLNTESDLLKVYRLLDKLAESSGTETDEELINRVFDGVDPKDMERVVTILQRKGGRDE